jgi:hypothetical protein
MTPKLFLSSLPDLIRQSMLRCACMDRRVKPAGDEIKIASSP